MERYKVILSQKGKAEIRAIVQYIAVNLHEPDTAKRMQRRFKEMVASLKTMPKRFAPVPDSYLASAGFRITFVGNYLVFYTLDEDKKTVNISRVLNGRQNWIELLTQDQAKTSPGGI